MRNPVQSLFEAPGMARRGRVVESLPEADSTAERWRIVPETVTPGGLEEVVCEVLESGDGWLDLAPGDRVVYLLGEQPGEGYVVGRLAGSAPRRAPLASAPPTVGELRFEARDAVVLTAGKSKLLLRANGDIELIGIRIISRARKLQKLLAPMLRLN